MPAANYKAPLMKAMVECGFAKGTRTTFTHVRKRTGRRRLKLWLANDVWKASHKKQVQLVAALKKHYGDKYLCGYFIDSLYGKSFCIVLDKDLA